MDEALVSELRRLLDRQAIVDLIHRYAEGIDRRDADLLATVFTPDCTLHYGADYDEPASALIESWRPGVESPILATHHHVGNIQIRFQGECEARSVTYLHAIHLARRDGVIVDEMVRARYLDRLVKRDGDWRFGERWIVYDWSRVAPSDETRWWDTPDGAALSGAHGAEDPSHGFLSGERVPTGGRVGLMTRGRSM